MANVTINPTDVIPDSAASTVHQQPANIVAGEAIAAGEIVCLLAADGFYYKADANSVTLQNVKGMAGNSPVAAGQRLDIITQTPAIEIGAHAVAVGTPLFVSNTPGKLCPLADLTSGSLPILVAYTVTATAIQIVIATATTPIP